MTCPVCRKDVVSLTTLIDAAGKRTGCRNCVHGTPRPDTSFARVPGSNFGGTLAHYKDIRSRAIIREGGTNYVERRTGRISVPMGR